MIRNIVRDAFFLQMPSSSAGKEDLPAVYDLIDTFRENRNRCVGMAANMIGIRKNIRSNDVALIFLFRLIELVSHW